MADYVSMLHFLYLFADGHPFIGNGSRTVIDMEAHTQTSVIY